MAPLITSLVITCVVLCVVLVVGLVVRWVLLRRLERRWMDIPRDAETGLLERRICLPRLAAEVKRAQRTGGDVWVGVVTVVDGDAARFGRMLHDALRLPEVGFRLSERVMCVARPDMTDARRRELLQRIAAAAPRERLAIGEATWRAAANGQGADELLRRASQATTPASRERR